MKKTLLLIVTLLLISLTSCSNSTCIEREIETTVVECRENTYLDQAYVNLARNTDSLAMYKYYTGLAYKNARFDYTITVNIGGRNYNVTRQEKYEVGDLIKVTEATTLIEYEGEWLECDKSYK